MFYRMTCDMQIPRRAFIAPIRTESEFINEDALIRQPKLNPAPLFHGEISQIGTIQDINFGPHDILICGELATNVLTKFAQKDIQPIPIVLSGEPRPFFYIHLLKIIDCIDSEKSVYTRWSMQDH